MHKTLPILFFIVAITTFFVINCNINDMKSDIKSDGNISHDTLCSGKSFGWHFTKSVNDSGSISVNYPKYSRTIHVDSTPCLTMNYIDKIEIYQPSQSSNLYSLKFYFSKAGSLKLCELSKNNSGRGMVLIIENVIHQYIIINDTNCTGIISFYDFDLTKSYVESLKQKMDCMISSASN